MPPNSPDISPTEAPLMAEPARPEPAESKLDADNDKLTQENE